jgi:hypothetical protein
MEKFYFDDVFLLFKKKIRQKENDLNIKTISVAD